MVVPRYPAACLVVGHAYFAFGIAEVSFYAVALDSVSDEFAGVLVGGGIAQGVVFSRGFGTLAVVAALVGVFPGEEPPGFLEVVFDDPDALGVVVDFYPALVAVSYFETFPFVFGGLGDDLGGLFSGVAGAGLLEWFFASFGLVMGPGGLLPEGLVVVDFGDEGFAVLIEGVEEVGVAAVAAVHAYYVEVDALGSLVAGAF